MNELEGRRNTFTEINVLFECGVHENVGCSGILYLVQA